MRVAVFVRDHPGCTVGQVMEHLGVDAADAWNALIDAERTGTIRMTKPDGQKWQFYPAEESA